MAKYETQTDFKFNNSGISADGVYVSLNFKRSGGQRVREDAAFASVDLNEDQAQRLHYQLGIWLESERQKTVEWLKGTK